MPSNPYETRYIMNIHLQTLDFLVIAGYVVAVLAIGFLVSFRRKHSDDLFLAGRTLGWGNIGFSIWATNINPSVLIAFCSTGYTYGVVGGNYSWLAWPFLMLLAVVFIPHYLNTKVSTMPEFLSRRYGESCRTFLSWYVVFSTLTIWLGFTLYAGCLIITPLMHWPFWASAVFLTVVSLSFTVTGGLAAVAITDTFQSILMIVGSVILTAIGIDKVGGVQKLWQAVPPDFWQLFQSRPDDPTFPFNWYSVLAGYFTAGIWFWCTDQTIVQRVLGARDLRHGQMGAMFTGFLKILDVLVFLLPGIICYVLHPGLEKADDAYLVMITTHLPTGMVGLMIAVLMAALVSTIAGGINSLSTVVTLDIYQKNFRPDADQNQIRSVGRITTLLAGLISVGVAVGLNSLPNRDLFEKGQAIIGFLAPPMAVVFLLGVFWKRANRQGAFATLLVGSMACIVIGVLFLGDKPYKGFWPAFPFLSFMLFAGLLVFMVIVSLLTPPPGPEQRLPTLRETYSQTGHSPRSVWKWWILLALIMLALYLFFNLAPLFLK
jgi:solute:Na+ symporter, SSS family